MAISKHISTKKKLYFFKKIYIFLMEKVIDLDKCYYETKGLILNANKGDNTTKSFFFLLGKIFLKF